MFGACSLPQIIASGIYQFIIFIINPNALAGRWPYQNIFVSLLQCGLDRSDLSM